MTRATTTRTMARIQKLASGSESTTSLSAITMISADRMKSVRMAPGDRLLLVLGRDLALRGELVVAASASGAWPLTFSHTFSAPS